MPNFIYPQTILVKPAAALVANSPYTLSNATVGDVPTATIAAVNTEPHIFVGKAATQPSGAKQNYEPGDFYNATVGKRPEDIFAPGDTFAVVLKGYPTATLRTSAAITEGVQVTTKAAGQVGPAAATDRKIIGITLAAQATVNGPVPVLVQVVANPLFVPV